MTPSPCAEAPEMWFSDDPIDQREAARICLASCGYVDMCRRAVVKAEADLPPAARRWGVWAGILPADRAAYARAVALAHEGAPL